MATANPERVRAVVAPVVSAAGLDLENLTVTSAGRRRLLRIGVDRDGGVSLDDVALVSQRVSQALDDTDVMGGQPYVLEVGSPGVDHPLSHPRHWRRAVGRIVQVQLIDGGAVTGRLLAVGADDIVIDVPGADRRLGMSQVRHARVQVEFGAAADAGPRDHRTTGDPPDGPEA
jgi:ribosome maturation factor RimP